MILSMTGYGRAEVAGDHFVLTAEVRAVNSRYLNIKQRIPDALAPLGPRLERLLRSRISRGSVTLTVKSEAIVGEATPLLNQQLLKAYWRDIEKAQQELGIGGDVSIGALLSLPGVAQETGGMSAEPDAIWPELEQVVAEALERVDEMRKTEGQHTEDVLRQLCQQMSTCVEEITNVSPRVVEQYQQRLRERTQRLLDDVGIELAKEALLKEVAMFAERSDVAEELSRLESHTKQFVTLMDSDEPAGRKFSFIAQEMHREANTIGAKASDAQISRLVLEVKAVIDRIREQVENIQ